MLKTFLLIIGAIVLVVVLVAGGFVVQTVLTNNAIEQEWQMTRVDKIQNLGTTKSLEILPLFEEARARQDLELEHGVSYLVKTQHGNFLLDVGMNPTRLSHNTQVLNVTEKDFAAVVITHIHPDHMGGTNAWWSDTVTAGDPPLALDGKQVYVPLPVSNTDMNTTVVTQPLKLADGVATLGAIPFPELFPLSLKSQRNAEQVPAVNVEGKGIVLIMQIKQSQWRTA